MTSVWVLFHDIDDTGIVFQRRYGMFLEIKELYYLTGDQHLLPFIRDAFHRAPSTDCDVGITGMGMAGQFVSRDLHVIDCDLEFSVLFPFLDQHQSTTG
jgi:hypothetical protein